VANPAVALGVGAGAVGASALYQTLKGLSKRNRNIWLGKALSQIDKGLKTKAGRLVEHDLKASRVFLVDLMKNGIPEDTEDATE
jgi:hypothetical protein